MTEKEKIKQAAKEHVKNKELCLIPNPDAEFAASSHENYYCACDLSNSFLKGAEWERERAKVLVEALKYYANKVEMGKDAIHPARGALAKYRKE